MALNKFMHPRNIYKTPPDFSKLAKSFEEFSFISKVDVTGKVNIDFKDPHALRVLTKCLLKSDFGLDVVIPEDRLVPTLPLRLNYILWIEDLLESVGRKDDIKGLDIGTGACAIYPLLAAVKNKWHMLGTETDKESYQKATENVERNNLQQLIELTNNSTASLIDYLFTEENSCKFDFCMCNPPFYSNVQELCESRSPARLPPKNGFTGSPQELITDGGELAFCRKMIQESKVHKDNILIFSTMVGHKFNLKELVQDLKSEGIKHTNTEFCQGRVTRWGLAWTYQEYDIDKLVPAREKLRKKVVPIVHIFPKTPESLNNFEAASKKILDILQTLKIDYKILNKRGNFLYLDMRAVENTWTNQRRKRRLMKQLNEEHIKKPKLEINLISQTQVDETVYKNNDKKLSEGEDKIAVPQEAKQNSESDTCIKDNKSNNIESCRININESNKIFDDECDTEADISNKELIVHAFVKLLKKNNNITLELEFIGGTSGKEGLHQILQYIKNNWK